MLLPSKVRNFCVLPLHFDLHSLPLVGYYRECSSKWGGRGIFERKRKEGVLRRSGQGNFRKRKFLFILNYILCLWLAVPPLKQDALCRKEETSSFIAENVGQNEEQVFSSWENEQEGVLRREGGSFEKKRRREFWEEGAPPHFDLHSLLWRKRKFPLLKRGKNVAGRGSEGRRRRKRREFQEEEEEGALREEGRGIFDRSFERRRKRDFW